MKWYAFVIREPGTYFLVKWTFSKFPWKDQRCTSSFARFLNFLYVSNASLSHAANVRDRIETSYWKTWCLFADDVQVNRTLYQTGRTRAVQYLESQLTRVTTDPYSLSIICYALTLANSSRASSALQSLNALAIDSSECDIIVSSFSLYDTPAVINSQAVLNKQATVDSRLLSIPVDSRRCIPSACSFESTSLRPFLHPALINTNRVQNLERFINFIVVPRSVFQTSQRFYIGLCARRQVLNQPEQIYDALARKSLPLVKHWFALIRFPDIWIGINWRLLLKIRQSVMLRDGTIFLAFLLRSTVYRML